MKIILPTLPSLLHLMKAQVVFIYKLMEVVMVYKDENLIVASFQIMVSIL